MEQPPPRADRLFRFDEMTPDLAFIDRVWRTRNEPAQDFQSVASAHWELVITWQDGRPTVTVHGPETHATVARAPADATVVGIRFKLGAFIPSLPLDRVVDGSLTLPVVGKSFWLNGRKWEVPDFADADLFVRRLAREDLLTRDPVVEAALCARTDELCLRSVQRRFLRATGLTRTTLKQIQRAERAVELLDSGASILDAVDLAGYADQPHLTRSLRRFVGRTPAQIAGESAA
jgi:AraC-like DNA-binding protein